MFEAQESTPWYRSVAGLIGACLLLPPVGLTLLWARRDAATELRFSARLASCCLERDTFSSAPWCLNPAQRGPLRRSRTAPRPAANTSRRAGHRCRTPVNATASPCGHTASWQRTRCERTAPAGHPSETAAAHAVKKLLDKLSRAKSRWPYDEMAVLKQWPAADLSPIWKQPIGVGYRFICHCGWTRLHYRTTTRPGGSNRLRCRYRS